MTTPPPPHVLRRLTAEHREELADFTCVAFGQPWTVVVQDMVRERLAGALALGAVSGLGLWQDGVLCGVAAWAVEGDLVHCSLVAVRTARRRRGIGRTLKKAVLRAAAEAGAIAVESIVHWDNDAMIELNAELGANIERIRGNTDYCRCIIPISGR